MNLYEEILFDKNGEFEPTLDISNMLETILIILENHTSTSMNQINIELRRCGFFISQPDLKKVLKQLKKTNYVIIRP